jgi:hypothetical protein
MHRPFRVRWTAALVATMATLAVSSARADDPVPEPAAPPVPPAEANPAPPPPVIDARNEIDRPPLLATPPPKKKIGVTGRFHGGLGQRSFYDNSALGADLTASFGAYIENLNVYFDVQALFASSEGLPVRQILAGPSVDFQLVSRLRLGAGIALGGTTVSRVTGGTMSAFSAGLRVFTSVDLFDVGERGAMYVLGQLSVTSAGTFLESNTRGSVPTAAVWGPTIAAGVRF